MKIKAGMSLNDSIRIMCAGHTGAASIVTMLMRDRPPSEAMEWMRVMDRQGIYGVDIWRGFTECGSESSVFFLALKSGTLAEKIKGG